MRARPLAEDQDSITFWQTHDRSGQLVAVIGGSIVALYAAATWGQANRGWLLAIGAVTAVLPAAGMAIMDVERLVRSRWGAPYYYALELLGVVIVVTAAWLDGGPDSPLTLLLMVLLVHGLGAYPPAGTLLTCGAITLGYLSLHALAATDVAVSLVGGTTIAATAFFGWHAACNHKAVHRHEAAMSRVLRRLADEDGLTGLANRRATYARLSEVTRAAGADRPMSVLALDVDAFKRINDTGGHLVGDQVLQSLAAVLRRVTRAGDVVGRLGGDEFVVVLPATAQDAAVVVAERVHAAVSTGETPFRVSIGVACATRPTTPDALMERADAALYRAKQAGGATTRTAPPQKAEEADTARRPSIA